jgi:hypothetical protein
MPARPIATISGAKTGNTTGYAVRSYLARCWDWSTSLASSPQFPSKQIDQKSYNPKRRGPPKTPNRQVILLMRRLGPEILLQTHPCTGPARTSLLGISWRKAYRRTRQSECIIPTSRWKNMRLDISKAEASEKTVTIFLSRQLSSGGQFRSY